ncbi:MAG: serine hydrolase, partial [Anaerolineae bacterium]
EMGLRRGVLALAETVDGAYMVALITQPDEYDALYEAVFLPAVDALAPVSDLPSRYEVYNGWPHVASIEAVGHSARETVDFRLETCTRLRVYAIGQLQGPSMVDYGYVEDATTGQIVWQMYPFETESAGYVQNRRADRPLTLPAGAYRLHYHSDASHAFDDWGDRPPSHRFWGISLFVDQEPGAPPPQCLPRAEHVEDIGWSAVQLAQLGAEFADHDLAAVLVLSQGQVVLEWGNTANNFLAHSMRKSLMSAMYGIAVDRGLVDPGQTLAALGIDDINPLTEQERQATVEELLQARSGVYIPAAGEVQSMRDDRPARGSHAPGSHWYYNNWDFNALGTIFEQETGQNIYQAFAQWIGAPTGAQDFFPERLQYTYEYWLSQHPYYGFRISARDLARFGQLLLQAGNWQGSQVVPRDWVELTTQAHSRTQDSGTYSGYGYMWWVADRDDDGIPAGAYAASGFGGHTVEVLPQLETVIVLRPNTDAPEARLLGSDEADDIVRTILQARMEPD